MSVIVNLEFSRTTIKCVCLQKKGSNLIVTQAHTLEADCDVFNEENSEKVASLLTDFFRQHHIPLGQVYFSICHGDIVFQELTLPVMPTQEVHEAIKNEIERVPRFAAEEYHYSYQRYQPPGEDKVYVLSLAIPESVFAVPLGILKAAGCAIQGFDVVPLSVLSLSEGLSAGKDVGVLVVCQQITYLLIMRDTICQRIYLANSGTNDLLQSKTSMLNEPALKLWLEEIRRILKYYEVEQHSAFPQMYIVWDNERAPNLEKRLGAFLSQEVLPLELSKTTTFSKKRNFLKLNQTYVPLVGMALASNAHHGFNLQRIWNKKKTGQYQRKIITFGVIYLVCTLLLGGRLMFFFSQRVNSLNTYQQGLARQIEELEKRTDKLRADRAQYEQLKENILKQATVISNLNRRSWAKTFATVAENIPQGVWLGSFMFSREGECKIEGKSFYLDTLADFMRALKKTGYFSEVKLDFTKERQVEGEDFVEFGMQMKVRIVQDIPGMSDRSGQKRTD
ncbi:MAG: PilN domain-containing protein [Candidatus Omnitrophica bacterium]|nr:PilN domain-containing protein [Candidatus Omnitrophota bacterium]